MLAIGFSTLALLAQQALAQFPQKGNQNWAYKRAYWLGPDPALQPRIVEGRSNGRMPVIVPCWAWSWDRPNDEIHRQLISNCAFNLALAMAQKVQGDLYYPEYAPSNLNEQVDKKNYRSPGLADEALIGKYLYFALEKIAPGAGIYGPKYYERNSDDDRPTDFDKGAKLRGFEINQVWQVDKHGGEYEQDWQHLLSQGLSFKSLTDKWVIEKGPSLDKGNVVVYHPHYRWAQQLTLQDVENWILNNVSVDINTLFKKDPAPHQKLANLYKDGPKATFGCTFLDSYIASAVVATKVALDEGVTSLEDFQKYLNYTKNWIKGDNDFPQIGNLPRLTWNPHDDEPTDIEKNNDREPTIFSAKQIEKMQFDAMVWKNHTDQKEQAWAKEHACIMWEQCACKGKKIVNENGCWGPPKGCRAKCLGNLGKPPRL